METPIKVLEKGGYCFYKTSADVQVSDHAAKFGYTAQSSEQFPVSNWTSHTMPASNHCMKPAQGWEEAGKMVDLG